MYRIYLRELAIRKNLQTKHKTKLQFKKFIGKRKRENKNHFQRKQTCYLGMGIKKCKQIFGPGDLEVQTESRASCIDAQPLCLWFTISKVPHLSVSKIPLVST